MSLSIKEVINAQILPQAAAAQRRDLSMVAIFTSEVGEAFTDASTRYVFVADPQDVANLFGSDSNAYKAAQSLFSARPKLKRAMIARFAKEQQEIAATANALKGSTLSAGINAFKAITDGAVTLNVGGKETTLSGMDFSAAIDFTDIAAVINSELPEDLNLQAIWDAVGHRFIIQAKTAGAYPATRIGYATEPTEGTYIGSMLKWEDGQATIVTGKAAITVKAESPSEALHHLENQYQNWYGVYFADTLTDEQLDDAHTWVTSADLKVLAYTAIRDEQIEWNNDNLLKKLFDKNSGRLIVQFNKTGDDHAAAELLAIAVSTLWQGQNTAKTVKFKQQTSVRSDDRVTQNEAQKCKRLGINFYTDYDGINMLAEGTMLGGTFIDEVMGLDAFTDACQKQAFTTLQAEPTKVPQTDKGQARLIGSLVVIGNEFVRNGFLAGGIWRGNDVGELTYNDRLDDGFYFYSDSFDTQSQADREDRKMMPIMCAIKLAGAGHSADLLIQFNR
ncbi:DUF3383 domain-containing protein (plasmid) [Providencia rettgeri]|uniref:Protein of uncharacterized function (DUF3383) n=1 Tax=Providencia rettgeri TaxID=587 RepID=A0A379FTN9_PRORE|nr:DUF3383 domain-containing protein [Providencia rettgeri]QXB04719.1 DUF3383 domain-containing protein [Providencia rettgeri]QXB07895.1 DUF3383 domain-containing protein [Providencia rettgeri]SUC31944.1 Protein of uncharacterised function (DUF3383) [Providencia rettgeri]SUC32007.1 Protein of uncharacterised function (DUF3383) [Providencia rettgeri]